MMKYENIQERRAEVRYRVMLKSKTRKNPEAYMLGSLVSAMLAGLFTLTYDSRVLVVACLMALTSVHCAYVAYWQNWFLERKSVLELDK